MRAERCNAVNDDNDQGIVKGRRYAVCSHTSRIDHRASSVPLTTDPFFHPASPVSVGIMCIWMPLTSVRRGCTGKCRER